MKRRQESEDEALRKRWDYNYSEVTSPRVLMNDLAQARKLAAGHDIERRYGQVIRAEAILERLKKIGLA